ncbi:AMP-dependent synthetase [Actinoplanes sp. SE50]|uniref:AMP-dependent synthetase/ligase n=1 Tax=unclassified Actinoplanes TaxID=2626549 RepID=UPI00023ED0E1|nr:MULTISPECIES: long-chain fatty acid--CoA ligase [unclassified Actinoplanes]AEV86103.1 long-chain acyl-CoA synthetase [Actinoplanes sp. SE50/110]ATO84501.1 AMP-dependent synthetase [Actinoplanes sp. SE50]SLM01911.1 AMP-dependent synthetase [Actinoplanes sp. SE50/110]
MTQTCTAPPAEHDLLTRLRRDEPASFGAMFLAVAERQPQAVAYLRPGDDGWQSQTWTQTARAVTEIAAGLLALGLHPEDRVAIASGTRVEWIEADFGVMCAGGATTTIYPSSSPDEVAHILTDSGSRFAIAENPAQLAKILFPGTPVERAVLIDGTAADPRVLTLAELRALGDPARVAEAVAAVRPDDLATLIYTSGTTGLPKGVRVAHRAWVYQGLAIQAMGIVRPDDVGYLWLPLSHAFGKALLSCQLSVGFPFAVDGDVSRVVQRLGEVRPTIMPAVPRIFEKVYAAVSAADGVQKRLLDWAVATAGRRRSGWRFRIADRLVLSRVRARFGGRMRYFISGAATLDPGIARWFGAIGLPIAEGYGLTESCATTVFNRPDRPEYGTVGMPLPGTEVRIAEDGEVLLRGPGMMQGYHGLDSGAALRDGWLHTGDIGEITERGSLRITDRKKDLIKTSNGKYVAPQTLESRFKAICPLAGQFLVHGENRRYVTALIDLDPDEMAKWAAANGLGDASHAEIAGSEKLRAALQECVDRLNGTLNPWETVKRFAVLDRHLSVESGELTASLKLRRRVIEDRFRPVLDGLYA